MYNEYKKHCESMNYIPATESMYRYIFNTSFNIGFHKPLKDQCDFCLDYGLREGNEKLLLQKEYERHIKNKELARESKEMDKSLAQTSSVHSSACFDLQQVIMLPKANNSRAYYSRKLNNYNLSVYSMGQGKAYCYLWNETEASRGACEIASCIFSFFKTLFKDQIKSVTTYSDNCSGQNRNRHFIAMLWYSLKLLDFDSITHKYLERGHTQNENDSVHSCIERAMKNVSLYTTAQLSTIFQTARRSNPYIVKDMTSDDFFDFKDLTTQIRNLEIDTTGSKIRWTEIKTVSFSKDYPDTCTLQYDYDGPEINFNLFPNLRNSIPEPKLNKLYNDEKEPPKLSKAKFRDLEKLCQKNVIPAKYHEFFENLPVEEDQEN